MADGRKRGRPRKDAGKVKKSPLNLRTDPAMRALLEQAAQERGHSLTQEVETRLRTSFIVEKNMGRHVHNFVVALGATIDRIEMATGHRWINDHNTYLAVKEAALRLLLWDRPTVPNDDHRIIMALEQRTKEADAETRRRLAELDAFRHERGVPSVDGRVDPGAIGENYFTMARWSEEDRRRNQELEAAVEQARDAERAERERMMEQVEPLAEAARKVKEIGVREAEQMMTLVPPMPKHG